MPYIQPFSANVNIPQTIQKAAEQFPTLTAVEYHGRFLTYHDLWLRSARLAQWLRQYNVKKGDIVACYGARSIDLVTLYLAIMRLGAAYLSLDPVNPYARLQIIASDAAPKLIVDIERKGVLPAAMPFPSDAELLQFDNDFVANVELGADDLAYIVYTSGSTGTPKGIKIPHKGVVNLINFYNIRHQRGPGVRVSNVSQPGFDASISELWPTLGSGASLVIADTQNLLHPSLFLDWLNENKIHQAYIPTALLQLLFTYDWPALPQLNKIFTGGDRLISYPPEKIPCPVYNQYGPSEITDFITEAELTPGVSFPYPPPIGKPIDHCEVLILNDEEIPVHDGEVGELYLDSPGIALGYLHQPEGQQNPFVANIKNRSGTLYRSGDLGRRLPDGAILFLGRKDRQLKLRGLRIEPAEIEKALLSVEGIQAALVLLKNIEGEDRLVAYYISAQQSPTTYLWQKLAYELPANMVPEFFVHLNSWPLNANGKIDIDRLPLPSLESIHSSELAPPSDPIENYIHKIMTDILNIKALGRDEDFFLVGGHSLSAGVLIGTINEHYGLNLPLTIMMHSSTIKELADIVKQGGGADVQESLIITEKSHRESSENIPVFCIHGFGGYTFGFPRLAKYLPSNIPLLSIRGRGIVTGEEPHSSVETMAQEYLDEIVKLQEKGPYRLVGYSLGGLVAWEIAQRLTAQGAVVDMLIMIDTFGPGYPQLRPWYQRYYIHLINLLKKPWHEKKQYLAKRLDNILRRIKHLVGLPHLHKEAEFISIEYPISKDLYFAHNSAYDNYLPKPYYGDVLLLRADIDLNYPGCLFSDESMGWKILCQGKLSVIRVPGDHFTLFKEPNVRSLADIIATNYQEKNHSNNEMSHLQCFSAQTQV